MWPGQGLFEPVFFRHIFACNYELADIPVSHALIFPPVTPAKCRIPSVPAADRKYGACRVKGAIKVLAVMNLRWRSAIHEM
jgi:hypothetical protein